MKTAFVFPGQGSQSVGMLAELALEFPQIKNTFSEASAVLGYDLWELCQQGPDSELGRTECTQPAILTTSIAIWRLWLEQGGTQPDVVAGHSLGEYSALVAAGVLDFAAAVSLVQERGRLMQQAVPAGVGAMAAVIGLDDALVVEACAEAAEGEVVSAVNFNSPGQVVIAGVAAAVERAGAQCKAKGARRVLPLPVSVPSHCALMTDAAVQLGAELNHVALETPRIPVVQNVEAEIESDPEKIRENLVKQLFSPVRWTETQAKLGSLGVGQLVEVGPGKVLSGLAKRAMDGVETLATATPTDFKSALALTGSDAGLTQGDAK